MTLWSRLTEGKADSQAPEKADPACSHKGKTKASAFVFFCLDPFIHYYICIMADIADIIIAYNKKVDALNAKLGKIQDKISSLQKQMSDLTTKYKDRSAEFIERERKKLQLKLDKTLAAYNKFKDEQTKKLTAWMENQKAKIEKVQQKALKLYADQQEKVMKAIAEQKAKNKI